MRLLTLASLAAALLAASSHAAPSRARAQLRQAQTSGQGASAQGTAEGASQASGEIFDARWLNPALDPNVLNRNSGTGKAEPTSLTASGPKSCGSGQFVDGSGNCQTIAVPAQTVAVAPWQKYIDLAQKLLLVIAALSLVAMAAKGTPYGPMVSYAIAALGALVALLGVMIMGMGQTLQGGILAAIGGFTAYMAYTNAEKLGDPNMAQEAAGGEIDEAQTALENDANRAGLESGDDLASLSEQDHSALTNEDWAGVETNPVAERPPIESHVLEEPARMPAAQQQMPPAQQPAAQPQAPRPSAPRPSVPKPTTTGAAAGDGRTYLPNTNEIYLE